MDANDRFDPYYTWLGIRPEEQPPDHYRLLGISRFEGNAEVIEHAADRQMSHLRSLQTGKHAAHGQTILNQISKARICLLDPRQKAQYDAMLATKLSATAPPMPVVTSGPYAPVAAEENFASEPYEANSGSMPAADELDFTSSGSSYPKPIKRPSRSKGGPSIIGALVGAVVAAAIVYPIASHFIFQDDPAKNPKNAAAIAQNSSESNRSNDSAKAIDSSSNPRTDPAGVKGENPSDRGKSSNGPSGNSSGDGSKNKHADKAANNNDPKTKPVDPDPNSTSSKSDVIGDMHDSKTKPPPANTGSGKSGNPNIGDAKSGDSKSGDASSSNPNSQSSNANDSKLTSGTDTSTKNDSSSDSRPPSPKDDVKKSETPLVKEPSRAAIPGDAAREKSEIAAKDLFSKELAAAKKPSEKSQLAGTFMQTAADLNDDLNGQYVLLVMARDLAISAGDAPLTMKAIDRLGEKFDIDLFKAKSDVLAQLSETVVSTSAQTAVVEAQLLLVEELVDKEDYAAAIGLSRSALDLAVKSKDARVQNRVKERGREIVALSKEHSQFNEALKALQTAPDDPAANTTAGRWFFFTKQEPEKAWPYFAKGSDAPFKELAAKELALPTDAGPQVELADGWWDLGQSSKVESEKNVVLLRSLSWYSKASGQLTGLLKTKADKRIGELKPIADKVAAKNLEKRSALGANLGVLKPGLYAEYYAGRNFDRYLGARVDPGPVLTFAEGRGSVIPSSEFSIRWTGYIVAQKPGNYRIKITSKDGSRFIVNGKSVIDLWKDSGSDRGRTGGFGPGGPGPFIPGGGGGSRDPNKGEAVVALGKQPTPIRLEYFQGRGEKQLNVTWELEGDIHEQPIPPLAFQHDANVKKGPPLAPR